MRGITPRRPSLITDGGRYSRQRAVGPLVQFGARFAGPVTEANLVTGLIYPPGGPGRTLSSSRPPADDGQFDAGMLVREGANNPFECWVTSLQTHF